VIDMARLAIERAPAGVLPENALREYLQSRILGILQGTGAFVPLAFMGGTALRFLFRVGRFSEDLDFSLERPDASGHDIEHYAQTIAGALGREGYDVDTRTRTRTAVEKVDVRFRGLLETLGLSALAEQTFMIRLEVDTSPPQGATLDVSTIDVYQRLRLQHHDRASLMAGKISAILTREYVKGRDVYDLIWYLTNPEQPRENLALLAASLRQYGRDEWAASPKAWPDLVRARLSAADWDAVRRDVSPLLAHAEELDTIDWDVLDGLLSKKRD
jgi:predicted nucleotidyltransferase component of viral defense system